MTAQDIRNIPEVAHDVAPIAPPTLMAAIFLILTFSIFVYTLSTFDKDPRRRLALILTRVVFLLGLLLLAVRPMNVFRATSSLKSSLYVLVDTSGSMGVRGPATGQPRYEELLLLLRSEQMKGLEHRLDLKYLGFSDGARIVEKPDSAPLGGRTDIAAALAKVLQASAYDSVAEAALFSDGRVTRGADPADLAGKLKEKGIRVHTVLLGASSVANVRPDSSVEELSCPEKAFAGEEFAVAARLRFDNLVGQEVAVRLLDGDKLLESRAATPSATPERRTLEFKIKLGEVRPHRLVLDVSRSPGEILFGNNAAEKFVDVVPRKPKVCVVVGKIDSSTRAFTSACSGLDGVEASFIRLFEKEMSEQRKAFLIAEARKADVLVISSLPDEELAKSFAWLLEGGEKGVSGVVWLPSDDERDHPAGEGSPSARLTGLALGKLFRGKGVRLSASDGPAGLAAARKLGGKECALDIYEVAPLPSAAKTCLSADGKALIARSELGGRGVVAFATNNLWKLNFDESLGRYFYRNLLQDAVWAALGPQAEGAKGLIVLSKHELSPGELLSGTVFPPRGGRGVSVFVEKDGKAENIGAVKSDQLYKFSYEPKELGFYKVVAEFPSDGGNALRFENFFAVKMTSEEMADTSPDVDTMKKISERGGGKFFTASNFEEFPDLMPRLGYKQATRSIVLNSVPIWDRLAVLLLMILALFADFWIKR